jgi:3-phosphoshikimate 1-carboxyvinyltransferase
MQTLIVNPCASTNGAVSIPGDKSISHRALMFSSLALGKSEFKNLLEGHDCLATLAVMRSLGAHIGLLEGRWWVNGQGRHGLIEPQSILHCQNSGTTIRLLAGLLAGMNFMAVLDGSDQIKGRPMDRVLKPLSLMNARVYGRKNNRLAPLVILPSELKGQNFALQVKSAQVKSAIILAGLHAQGETRITNTKATRDHTELMLQHMGADIVIGDDEVIVKPLSTDLLPLLLEIPGDISSAAFLLVAGACRATTALTLKNVGVNPTRTGIIDALKMMGANIVLGNERVVANEKVADITVKQSELQGQEFGGDLVVRMIDEIPILALLATQAHGETIIRDAGELKVKETNRIVKTVSELTKLGANIKETDDGMVIKGPTKLTGGVVNSHHDHRLALLGAVAGLLASKPVKIENAAVMDDSFPGFVGILRNLHAVVSEGL